MNTTFDLRSGIPLGYAFVSHVAAACGIRLLVIKGLQLSEQGLRAQSRSTDIDVLVAPEDLEPLVAALTRRGWVRTAGRDVPGVLPQHAVTIIHDGWPAAIDIHHYYPGFFAAPEAVFEQLWSSRMAQEYAGQRVWGLEPAANAVFIGLHHVRHIASQRHANQYQHMLGRGFSPAEIATIDELTRVGRSCEVLAELRAHLGLAAVSDLTHEERRVWRYYQDTNEDGSTSAWLTAVANAPARKRLAVLFRAVWPSAAEIRAEYTFPAGSNVTAHRLRRLIRGTRALPAALRSLRSPGRTSHEGTSDGRTAVHSSLAAGTPVPRPGAEESTPGPVPRPRAEHPTPGPEAAGAPGTRTGGEDPLDTAAQENP